MAIGIKKMKGKALEHKEAPPSKGSIALPTKPNEPSTDLAHYRICMFGEKGAGKTSILSRLFPDTITFMYDPQRENLRIKQIPDKGRKPPEWLDFKKYCVLMTDKGIRPLFDPIDGVYQACIRHYCKTKNVKDLSDLNDHGKMWRAAIDDFQDTINAFRTNDIYPLFSSHVRSRPILVKGVRIKDKENEEKGQEPVVVQPTASGACWEYLRLATDMAWYIGYRGLARVLHVRGSEYVWAGGGIEDHFLQPEGYEGEGEQLNMIPLGKSPSEACDNIRAAWENELPGYFYA